MKQNEQALIDNFFKDLEKYADKKGIKTYKSSTGGSDRILGGDYILKSGSKYLLIEFKDNFSQLSTEGKKEKMCSLCVALNNLKNKSMKKLSLECHFISWGEKIDYLIRMQFNKYFNAICNQTVFKGSLNLPKLSNSNTIKIDEIFIEKAISCDTGLYFTDFNNYINWIFSITSSTGNTDLALLVKNDSGCGSYPFSSLSDLNHWIESNENILKETKSESAQSRTSKRRR